MLVSVIPVTCHNELVVIVGTLVAVPFVVYAVCVVRAFCLPLNVAKSSLVKYQSALDEAVPNLVLIVA
jgi:hypothetical protein